MTLPIFWSKPTRFVKFLDRPVPKIPTLRDKTIVNLFYENSTRTRISFELAQKRMGADVVNFSASSSSTKKGESLKDTIQNIESMKIDMVVVRHESPGAAHFLARVVDANIINAGDGAHEHPTQALLDMYTMRQRFGHIRGLKVAIIGGYSAQQGGPLQYHRPDPTGGGGRSVRSEDLHAGLHRRYERARYTSSG